jgi:uncharacterized membrane protein YbjE (DUF340 family)
MSSLLLYLGFAVVGYFIGSFLEKKGIVIKGVGKIQTACIMLLVFTMGSRIGSDEEIVKSLGTIGITAFIMTVLAMVGGVIAVFLIRKLFGFDKFGIMRKKNVHTAEINVEHEDKEDKPEEKSDNRMTIYIVVSVALGIISGAFILPDSFVDITGLIIDIGLCIILFFVGMDLGREGTIFDNFKKAGWRVVVFPFVIMAGSLIGVVISSLFLPLSVQDALCIGSGFGWYSLAPIMLTEYSVEISAISFMHNVMRELCAILFIPVVAKRIGYIECISLAGAAAMDVCLPIVERSTRGDIAVYSFISGVVLSAAVPIMVGFMMGL